MTIQIETSPRRDCILCKKEGVQLYKNLTDDLFGVRGLWNISKCKSCKLLWLNPYPNESYIAKLYTAYYTHENLSNAFLLHNNFSNFPRNKKIKYSILNYVNGYNIPMPKNYELLGKLLLFIPGMKKKMFVSSSGIHNTPNGKILDLGCGNGDFLLEMKYLNWNVTGIEVDDTAAEEGRQVGLNIITGTLEKGTFEDDRFDVIYTNNVIEHLPNPIEILVTCYKILKPGGFLIIKTCNNESFAHILFKENYRGLEIPRHYFVYSPSSIKILAKKTGFVTKSVTTSFNEYIWFSSYKLAKKMNNPAQTMGNKFIAAILQSIQLIILFIYPDRGDDILAIFQKPHPHHTH